MSPKEWKNRKEYVASEAGLPILEPIYKKVVLYDDKGRRAEGFAKSEDEARDKAHKEWNLKYR